MTKAGVSEKDIAKVVALGPELLGCNIAHKLDLNVKYFLSLGIRLRQLGEMIADFPMLLRYNPDVLRPKYVYLRKTMVRPLQKPCLILNDFLSHCLAVFNYPCPLPLSRFSAILLRVELSQDIRF